MGSDHAQPESHPEYDATEFSYPYRTHTHEEWIDGPEYAARWRARPAQERWSQELPGWDGHAATPPEWRVPVAPGRFFGIPEDSHAASSPEGAGEALPATGSSAHSQPTRSSCPTASAASRPAQPVAAASSPSTTSCNRSRRVIVWKSSRRIVSRLTLTRCRPASASAPAVRCRPSALVVSEVSTLSFQRHAKRSSSDPPRARRR